MRRFFLHSLEDAVLTGTEALHAAKVLRLQPGAVIAVCDAKERSAEAEVISVSEESVVLKMRRALEETAEAELQVHILQSLAKGEKMEWVLQKTVELGCSFFAPISADRSVLRLDAKKAVARQERWERIALEAAKQCKRSRIPGVKAVASLETALEALPEGVLLLVLYEDEQSLGLKEALTALAERPKQVALLIGPEGGLTSQEVALARQYGALVVRMGPRILRTETAAVAAAAIIMYELGDLGGASCQK
nr:16S rRNA (uracil(1498)-N(3))-methyltransferase [uncultured Anaeromusa sp.]